MTYLTWLIRRNEEKSGYQVQLVPRTIKYESRGAYSVVQVSHLSENAATDTFVDIVTPVHDKMTTLDPQSVGRLQISSAYYCNFIHYEFEKGRAATGTFVNHCSDTSIMEHEKRDGLDYFWLNMASINEAIFGGAGSG